MKCKTCGKEIRYASCAEDEFVFAGYCNEECFRRSLEWKEFTKNIKFFYHSLNEDQKYELWSLWDNGIFQDSKYERYIDKVFTDPRNE